MRKAQKQHAGREMALKDKQNENKSRQQKINKLRSCFNNIFLARRRILFDVSGINGIDTRT
jgi:hypothetical protein